MRQMDVLLTGSEGVVGKVLTGYTIAEGERPSLDAAITRVDARPQRGSDTSTEDWRGSVYNMPQYVDTTNQFVQFDLGDGKVLRDMLAAHDVVIHGAWSNEGILDPESYDPRNIQRVSSLLKTAAGLGAKAAPKLIILSSVNAHVPADWQQRREAQKLIAASEKGLPLAHNRGGSPGPMTTRYGWSKQIIESMARDYARTRGLDIFIPRLGGVNMADKPSAEYQPHKSIAESDRGKHFDMEWEEAVRLRHADLVDVVQSRVQTPKRPGSFILANVVSSSPQMVHKVPRH